MAGVYVGKLDKFFEHFPVSITLCMLAAGAETVFSSIDTAILALMLHPEVQEVGQRAIDQLTGGQRLLSLEDRSKLPYIDAVLRETLRWNPVAPLAVPHRLTQPDSYGQWELPVGTTVIANSWHMLHDEAVYPNPSEFIPQRFINADGTLRDNILDPREIAFGFGRRICPGRYLGEESLWIAIATIIYLFDLSLPTDENGTPIPPEIKYESPFICRPSPFQCVFTPRSQAAALLGTR
ncbi:cytochrome P450 [Chiua virens]|nr:cytochrome P450 [Chiua virens]